MSHPDWTPDAEPEPSAPDSWAAHNVRIRPRARPLPEVASESADSPGCAEALCTCGVSEENVALVGLDGVEPNGARRSTDRKYSMRKNARNDWNLFLYVEKMTSMCLLAGNYRDSDPVTCFEVSWRGARCIFVCDCMGRSIIVLLHTCILAFQYIGLKQNNDNIEIKLKMFFFVISGHVVVFVVFGFLTFLGPRVCCY